MRAFETYQEAKQEHLGNAGEQELLKLTYLQAAWAEMKADPIENEAEREEAVGNWMAESGAWFRENVLEHKGEAGKESRKDHLLNLFDHDPDQAVQELEILFKESHH